MKKIFAFTLAILRIFIMFMIIIVLYHSRKGFTKEQLDTAVWWGLFLLFDIWFQIMIPISLDKND